jgi:hypothetical protein
MSIYQSANTKVDPVKLLFLGDSGGGKTYKVAQLGSPGSKVAILNFDQNTSGLRRLPKEVLDNVLLVNPYLNKAGKEYNIKDTFKNAMELVELVLDDPQVGVLAIDTLTTMADALHWQLLGKKDPMAKPNGYDHWSYFQSHWKWFADQVLHSTELDKHIVVIAHDKVTRNAITSEVSREVLLDGGMKDTLALHFSDVWRAFPKVPTAGPIEYRVRTVPGQGFTCKCTLPIPEEFVWDKEVTNVRKFFINPTVK